MGAPVFFFFPPDFHDSLVVNRLGLKTPEWQIDVKPMPVVRMEWKALNYKPLSQIC
jgi:hypothetical protein